MIVRFRMASKLPMNTRNERRDVVNDGLPLKGSPIIIINNIPASRSLRDFFPCPVVYEIKKHHPRHHRL